ncbi:MAG: hypothetical protein H5T69_10700 [Chloroflexi bacterium]|nr:hypothetical protein [Chloroflexota bacterium]
MPSNGRYILAGAAIGACLGGLAGWALFRRSKGAGDKAHPPAEVDKRRLLRVLFAMIGVIRLIFDLEED